MDWDESSWDESSITEENPSSLPPSSPSSSCPNSSNSNDPYALRRSSECNLILRYDSSIPNPRDGGCYYLLSAPWFTSWQEWINGETKTLPGTITNYKLLDANGKVRLGLDLVKDYRSVNGMVYWLFKSLHGSSNDIRTWNVGWEGETTGGVKVEGYERRCRLDAEEEVRRMKIFIAGKGGGGGIKKADRPEREEEKWCFCLTDACMGAVIEFLFRCCRGTEERYKKLEVKMEERVGMLAAYDEDGEKKDGGDYGR